MAPSPAHDVTMRLAERARVSQLTRRLEAPWEGADDLTFEERAELAAGIDTLLDGDKRLQRDLSDCRARVKVLEEKTSVTRKRYW